jgi:hypothetical protein
MQPIAIKVVATTMTRLIMVLFAPSKMLEQSGGPGLDAGESPGSLTIVEREWDGIVRSSGSARRESGLRPAVALIPRGSRRPVAAGAGGEAFALLAVILSGRGDP